MYAKPYIHAVFEVKDNNQLLKSTMKSDVHTIADLTTLIDLNQ